MFFAGGRRCISAFLKGFYLLRKLENDASRSEAASPTGTNPTTVAEMPVRFAVSITSWTTGIPTPPISTAAIIVPMLSCISPILRVCAPPGLKEKLRPLKQAFALRELVCIHP